MLRKTRAGIISQQAALNHVVENINAQARSVTIAALAAGTRTCNLWRGLTTSSIRVGFHKPEGDAPAPPRVTPDLLSSDGPERRTSDALRKDADCPASITTTASNDGSLLMRVRTVRSLVQPEETIDPVCRGEAAHYGLSQAEDLRMSVDLHADRRGPCPQRLFGALTISCSVPGKVSTLR
jgi:hypothetical protein